MLPFSAIVEKAVSLGMIEDKDVADINDWLEAPWSWAARHGLLAGSAEN